MLISPLVRSMVNATWGEVVSDYKKSPFFFSGPVIALWGITVIYILLKGL